MTVPFSFYWTRVAKEYHCKNSVPSQSYSQDEWWTSLIKIAIRRFLSVWTCAVKHLIWCVHTLLRLKAARPPLIICQVSKKKKKRWTRAAPHGWAPRTLVVYMKPESRQADKMWNSWRGQEGKFQTNIHTCGISGAPKHFHVLDPQTEHTDLFFRSCMWALVV